jgi:acetyl-CoA acetyltransferase
MWRDFRDKVSIAGVATSDYRALYGAVDPKRTEYDIGLEVFQAALEDAGLHRQDIDGLIVSRIPSYTRFGELAGLKHLSFANGLEAGGRQSGLGLQYAAMVVASGLANCVALVYANNGRSVRIKYGGGDESASNAAHAAYGMTSPGAYTAMMFNRHKALFGTSEDALYEIARVNRDAAIQNPEAIMREPLTREAYENGRFIVEPLRLFDYCLINDGGVCIIVTATERARDMRKKPVKIRTSVASAELSVSYISPDFFYETGRWLSRVYMASDIDRADVNALMIYEHFTPLALFSVEALGFCDRGEGGDWINAGNLRPRPNFGYNTSGGHLSEGYMQGWALHVEAVRQLRGEARGAQIANCSVAQYVCLTTLATSHILVT